MCDLICAVFEAAMGKINASNEIMFEKQKKERKNGNKRNFYINPYLKDRLDLEFTAF